MCSQPTIFPKSGACYLTFGQIHFRFCVCDVPGRSENCTESSTKLDTLRVRIAAVLFHASMNFKHSFRVIMIESAHLQMMQTAHDEQTSNPLKFYEVIICGDPAEICFPVHSTLSSWGIRYCFWGLFHIMVLLSNLCTVNKLIIIALVGLPGYAYNVRVEQILKCAPLLTCFPPTTEKKEEKQVYLFLHHVF